MRPVMQLIHYGTVAQQSVIPLSTYSTATYTSTIITVGTETVLGWTKLSLSKASLGFNDGRLGYQTFPCSID